MNEKTIVVLSNVTSGLISFRIELLRKLKEDYHVVVIAGDTGEAQDIIATGCEFFQIKLARHGKNPIDDLKLECQYKRLLKRFKPFVVLSYTIKPNVYGGLASASLKIPFIANITGLGDAIENNGLLSIIAKIQYRRGLKQAYKVFFQNQMNCVFFLLNKLYKGDYSILPGSGVNLEKHNYEPYPNDVKPYVLSVVGRITKDKGIQEILDASAYLKSDEIVIQLIGACEGDYIDEIERASQNGIIKYVGRQKNIHEWYKNSHAILHASYHEGLSNALLEAAATGRPVLATIVPGCSETFDEGITGFGFKPRNVDSLVMAVKKFVALPYEEKEKMGIMGRKKMENEFNRQIVINKYNETIKEIEGEERK